MHFHEYSAIQSRLRFSEELQQALMHLGEMQHDGVPRPRDAEHMHADKVMEHPARCGVLHRLALLMRKRGVLLLAGGANTRLSSGIYQSAHRHDHQQRHDAFRLFEIERGGQKLRVFAEAKPAFGMPLACVACQERLGR
jgi:hypothetical protein